MAGGAPLKRAEIWWARLPPPDKTRPVVLVSREQAYAVRELITVAKVTTRSRGLVSEVALGSAEGLRRECVANCDDLVTIHKALLIDRIGAMAAAKIEQLDAALKFALGLE
jgi:mRNA interferase MazF